MLGQEMLDSLSPVFILSQRVFLIVLLPVSSQSMCTELDRVLGMWEICNKYI